MFLLYYRHFNLWHIVGYYSLAISQERIIVTDVVIHIVRNTAKLKRKRIGGELLYLAPKPLWNVEAIV